MVSQPVVARNGDTVVMVHGLAARPIVLFPLARTLKSEYAEALQAIDVSGT